MVDWPEPERTPVVHRPLQPQACIGVSHIAAIHLLLLDAVFKFQRGPGNVVCTCCFALRPHRQRIGGAQAQLHLLLGPILPEGIHQLAQPQQVGNLGLTERLTYKRLVPALAALDGLWLQRLNHLVFVGGHARIGQQEMEDCAFRQLRIPGQFLWGMFMPELGALPLAGFGFFTFSG